MAGKYFNQWQIGDTIVHEIRRTVTETDNLLFSVMTHNPQPLHIDAEAAKASEFGQILVNGTFTFALMVGLSVGDTTLGTLVANLGYDKLIMPKPVFIGEMVLLLVALLVAARGSWLRPAILACAVFLLFACWWYLRNWLISGDPIPPSPASLISTCRSRGSSSAFPTSGMSQARAMTPLAPSPPARSSAASSPARGPAPSTTS